MSSYGCYEECNGICICVKCTKFNNGCKPCMDCIGVHEDLVEEESESNGYLLDGECVLYEKKGVI